MKKKILHITHNMAVGGAEQVIRQLILAMDSSRYECSVLCIDGVVGSLGEDLQLGGVHVESVSRRSGFDKRAIREIRAIIKTGNFDIIHCHQYTPFCYGAAAAVFLKVCTIFTEHGRFHPDRFTWKRRIANQFLYRQADHIIAISKATKKALQRYEWIPCRAINVVYNGVGEPEYDSENDFIRKSLGIDDDAVVLGTISRLDSIKNQRMMILALAELLQKFSKTVLIMAGDGPERAELERVCVQLGVQKHVYFVGFVSNTRSYLQAIDIFLLTSFSEGTSMTLLEAMACSKAIVATSVGGNVEIIKHSCCGLLVDSNDTDGLVDALESLFNDEILRFRLGVSAREKYTKHYSHKKMVSSYEKLYS